MKKNETIETLITDDLYESLITDIAKEVIELKKQQGETLSNIDIKKAVLEQLKNELKQLRRQRKRAKKDLRLEERKLRQINGNLSLRNTRLIDLSDQYSSPGESYINLDDYAFSSEQPVKKSR